MTTIWKCFAAGLLVLPLVATAQDGSDGGNNRRGIVVSGQGEMSALPDRARVSLGADAFSPDLKTAEGEVNKVVRAFLAETKALGIEEKDVSTSGVSVNPEYAWIEQTHTQKLTGYRAQRQIEVMLRNLDQLGDLILRSTRAGITRVSPPQLESSRAQELTNQALAKAAQDARAKAQLLADTLGAKLGAVFRINASSERPPPIVPKLMAMRAAGAESGSDMGISTGEVRYSAAVTAEFELKP